MGLGAAVYLSEYASPRVRGWLKPIIEILATIPSVVLGFLAALLFAAEGERIDRHQTFDGFGVDLVQRAETLLRERPAVRQPVMRLRIGIGDALGVNPGGASF